MYSILMDLRYLRSVGVIRIFFSLQPVSPLRSNSVLGDQNSVFGAISSLYGHLLSDLLNETIDFIAKDVKSRGRAYKTSKCVFCLSPLNFLLASLAHDLLIL